VRIVTMEGGRRPVYRLGFAGQLIDMNPIPPTLDDHRGVTVVVTASHDSICPVAALQSLMERDPQPESAPLFRLSSGAFTRDAILRELETRLLRVGIPPDGYRGHSFRKGAAQEAHNNGLTQEEIQTLGRWSSDAVQRYFKTNRKRVIQLHRQFQTGPV
jgi:hypothetical protein